LLLLFGKRVGVAGRNRPAEVGGEGRALSTAAREDTSSPQKNAYTQRLGCFLELDKLRGVGLGTPIRGYVNPATYERYRVTLKYSAHSSSVRLAAACSSAARTNSSITDRCVTAPRRASLCSAKAVAVETQTLIRRSPLSPAVARFFRYAACRSAVVLAIATPLHSNRIVAG